MMVTQPKEKSVITFIFMTLTSKSYFMVDFFTLHMCLLCKEYFMKEEKIKLHRI